MDSEKVKLIIRNMELLIQSLKDELSSSESTYVYEEIAPYLEDDVDEFYDPSEEV